jgi:hypothetical protein
MHEPGGTRDIEIKIRCAFVGVFSLVSVLGPALSALARDAEHHYQLHVTIGNTVRIRGHVNYSHHCAEVIATTISVGQTPIHGSLSTRDEAVLSTDPELGTGDKCKGHSGQGKVVYYTRTSPGVDKFDYSSVSANGMVRVSVTAF